MFTRLKAWIDDALDIYKPEVARVLWPFFVYSYFDLVKKFYPKDAARFYQKFSEDFKKEHEYDLRSIEHIALPEHSEDKIATLYRDNKYRLSLSQPAFTYFMQFLESLLKQGSSSSLTLSKKILTFVKSSGVQMIDSASQPS